MSLVGVECHADRYFFGRLLGNKDLIRKERNDNEVIKGVTERSKEKFCIGIIDIDKNKKLPKDFSSIYRDNNNHIFKHKENPQFLILIGPRQFEHWINAYLTIRKTPIETFGFTTFDEFMECSKKMSPEKDGRFKNTIDFVIENFSKDENHILKLKKRIEYLLQSKYEFSIHKFEKL